MFRNPRENTGRTLADTVLPRIGRPPTPPNGNARNINLPTAPTTANFIAPTPTASRPTTQRSSTSKRPKQNQSILSFFGKTEKTEADNKPDQEQSGLFFHDSKSEQTTEARSRQSASSHPGPSSTERARRSESPLSRFNEDDTPVKRRRLEDEDSTLHDGAVLIESGLPEADARPEQPTKTTKNLPRRRGGFVEDSDEDGDDDVSNWNVDSEAIDEEMSAGEDLEKDTSIHVSATSTKEPLKPPGLDGNSDEHDIRHSSSNVGDFVPPLIREGTSMYNAGDFGDDENFEDEFFEEGEEYLERRWMQEQREMEIALDEDSKSESGTEGVQTPRHDFQDSVSYEEAGESLASCPMCGGSLKALTEAQMSSHVNACLDGNAPPLPVRTKEISALAPELPTSASASPASAHRRFQRTAVARPAQANPFALSKKNEAGQSAFTRLMSGHAEDAAWAEAASNEKDSRGRPAYQRTCPFYKIMPGFYICVDAFRYGKVENQNAYFLSHFHSDHYIGLTSSWAHGPIYASKVTCNLMRQVLRVDPKWLVPLEFEKKIEVPSTKGVFVTMIPANHCPGSSLYLFEKVIGKNKDGSPRMTRVLHCGDFRACPAHISHPLLRPDIVDAITGQTKQQIIDTCYLDTTYLTPKYSFPGQHDVIDACAQMCISLSKEIADGNDAWEQAKAERMGSTMSKFLEKSDTKDIARLEDDPEQKPHMRGRLLVVIGTYSIGKERVCLGIARALKSKIFAPPAKMRICKCLEDPELNTLLTSNPLEAQVHMQTLMEIRAETLHDYLVGFKPHFARVVGFRPTGWSYRPPTSRFTENPAVTTVLNSEGWKSRFTMRDLTPQRGSTTEAHCFGVPYSEHSSFRELTMFCCALRISRVVPTVNVGSARSREKMKGWIDKWDVEKRKNGLYRVEDGAEGWGSGDGALHYGV